MVTCEIFLGEPGEQGLWETGDVIGIGRVPAMAVLPNTEILAMGTLLGNGTSRCCVRRRGKGGAWGSDDLLHLFPDIDCRALDLEVDEDGAAFFLMETQRTRVGGSVIELELGDARPRIQIRIRGCVDNDALAGCCAQCDARR